MNKPVKSVSIKLQNTLQNLTGPKHTFDDKIYQTHTQQNESRNCSNRPAVYSFPTV